MILSLQAVDITKIAKEISLFLLIKMGKTNPKMTILLYIQRQLSEVTEPEYGM